MTDAITYDDVLLVPSYNHWESRRVVDVSVTAKSGQLRLDLDDFESIQIHHDHGIRIFAGLIGKKAAVRRSHRMGILG